MIEQFFSSLLRNRQRVVIFSASFAFAVIVLLIFVATKDFLYSSTKSDQTNKPDVLAEADSQNELLGEISFNIPAIFNAKTTFNEDVKINNKNLDLGTGSISASNIVYSLRPGANISITGDRQNPTISASISGNFVTTLQGQSGAVALVEGTGITVDGLTIINSDPGSAQSIFKTIVVDGSSITASSNNDSLELAAGTGISLATDGKKVTITNTSPGSGGGGSTGAIEVTQDGTTVVTALTTLDFAGSDFTVTESPTGEANITTVLGSTINLASGEVTGILPIANGGTGANSLADLIALGSDTTGSYVATVTGGSGISIIGGGPGEGLTPTFSLGALSTNWNQTAAFDIVLNNANSELQILESAGGTFFGTIDVGDLGANRTYTFPDGSGTVCILELGNCGGGGGGISGGGTVGQIPFFTGATTLSSETTGFAWDSTNKRLGLGTDTPGGKLHVDGASTGQALVIFNQTGDQNILTASSSGTTRLTLDNTGNLNIIGGAYQIGGTNVLTGTTLGAGVVNSSLTGVGTLNSGSIASGFGTITTSNTITGTTINGTTGLNTGAGAGTQRIDASGNLTNITGVSTSLNPTAANTYNLGTGIGNQFNNVYANTIYQNGNQVCDLSNNCGSLTTTYWDQLNGALRPKNSTVDLLVGGQSSESAKFAILNVNSGTPTASVSGTSGAAYLTANGTLQTTANQTLTIGGNTTGNITLSPQNGSGTVFNTGTMNLATGKTYQINGIDVLTGTTLGAGILNSSLTSVGALDSGSIGNGFGTIATTNTITGSTINGTTGLNTGAGAGTQRIDGSGNLLNIGTIDSTYLDTSTNVVNLAASTVLQFDGTTVIDASRNVNNIVGVSTSLNPTAANTYNLGTAVGNQYNTIYGNTIFQNGNQVCDASGNCAGGAGGTKWQRNSNVIAPLTVTDLVVLGGNTTTAFQFEVNGKITGKSLVSLNETGDQNILTASASGATVFSLNRNGNLQFTGNSAALNTLTSTATTARTYTLPDGTGTVCLVELGNCAGSGGGVTGSGTNGQIAYFNGAGSITSETSGFTWDATNDRLGIGTNTPDGKFQTTGASTGKALAIFNETGDQNILTASASGTSMLNLDRSGNLAIEGMLSDLSDAALTINDNLNLVSGNVFQINGTEVLSTNTLGVGITSSSLTTVGTLTSGTWNATAIGAQYGGTGINTSAATGVPTISGGTWSVSSALAAALGGTGDDTSSTTGVPYISGGNWQYEAQLSPARGGTGVNGSTAGNGTLLIGNGSGFSLATLTAGNGIAITNGSGSITIEQTGVGSSKWTQSAANGILYPNISTLDMLVGGTSTSSAKFGVLNVAGGTPTASLSAGAAGGTYLAANGLLQTTNNQALTLGGDTTGNIILSPQNGAGTVMNTGTMNLATGKTYQIAGTDVLSGTTLGSGVINSSLTSVGALNGGSITSGFGTIDTGDTITGTTINGTTGINTGGTGGTQRIDASGNLVNIGTIDSTYLDTTTNVVNLAASTVLQFAGTTVIDASRNINNIAGVTTSLNPTSANTYNLGTGTGNQYNTIYGNAIFQNGNQVCDTSNNCGIVTYWDQLNGALRPKNSTVDLLVGGQSTESAKFAFMNVNAGTPTASISAITTANALTLDASGNIGTTNRQSLTIGTPTTGNITIGNGVTPVSLICGSNNDCNISADASQHNTAIGGLNGFSATTVQAGLSGLHMYSTGNIDMALFSSGTGVGIGSLNAPIQATLDVKGMSGTTAIASISGQTANATMIVDNRGVGDLFTASSSGAPRFTIANNGNLVATGTLTGLTGLTSSGIINFTGFTTNGGLLYTNGTGTVAQTTAGSAGECLQSVGGGTPTWGACAGANYWQLNNGTISPFSNTLDLLVGGTSTPSAKFAVLNMTGSGTPTASVSAGTAGGTYLDATGKLATTAKQTLTLGDSTTTGNIIMNPSGVIGVGTTSLAGNYMTVQSNSDSNNTLVLRNRPTQSADILKIVNSNNDDMFVIDTFGGLDLPLGQANFGRSVGIGTAASAGQMLRILTDDPGSMGLSLQSQNNQTADLLNVLDASLNVLFAFDEIGNLRIGAAAATADTGKLNITGAFTGKALAILNETGNQDIFTASSAGTTRFTIGNNGNLTATGTLTGLTGLTSSGTIQFSGFTNNGGLLYTNGTGTVAQTTIGANGECLLSSGGGAPTWGACAGGTNYWQLNSGAISPFSNTADLLVGGTSTASAKFAVTNINGSATPFASVSATTASGGSGNGITLGGDGSIQSLRNNTLTIGGNTTGNIALSPRNGSGLITANASELLLSGTTALTGTSLTSFTGGATAIDFTEFDVDATTGSVTINDGGNNGNLSVEGTVLDIDSLGFTGTGVITTGGATDLTINPAGGNVVFSDGDLLNVGGTTATYNTFADSTVGSSIGDGDSDVYIGDELEVDGAVRFDSATITLGNAAFTTCGTLGTSSGTLTCGSATSSNYWQLNNGAISPFSNTLDVLVGGTASNSAVMKISPSGTSPTASISANTSHAGLLVDNRGSGDIFTASSSGLNRFVIAQNGDVGIGKRPALDSGPSGATITATGSAQFTSISGMGLTDCDGQDDKLLWDAQTKKFSCGADRASVQIRKASDQSSTTTTFANDNELSFAIGANETWIYRILINVTISSSSGFKYQITAPSGSTCNNTDFSTDNSDFNSAVNQACSTSQAYGGGVTNGSIYYEVYGSITNGATPGNVTLQFARNAGGGTATVEAGSSLFGFKTTGADVAETYFSKDRTVAPGDVVMVDGSIKAGVQKTNKAYDSRMLGIISTQPGLVLGDDTKPEGFPVLLALNGRVPVKVASNSAAIKAGDLLTTSDESGKAMKATKAGSTIAKALEDWTPGTGQRTVMAFVNLSSYDPDNEITDVNDLSLASDPDNQSGRYRVTDSTGATIAKVGRFSDIAAANVKAGAVDAKSLTIDGINIFDLFKSKDASNDPALPEGMEMKFADLTNRLENLEQKVASNEAKTAFEIDNLKKMIEEKTFAGASQSAELQSILGTLDVKDATIADTLNVLGKTTVNDLGVTGNFTAGVLSINGLDDDGHASINTMNGDLKLQSAGVGGIDILAGKIKIDKDGNMTIKENLTAKTVTTTKLNLVPDTTSTPSASVLSTSAGSVVIEAGEKSIEISTTALTPKSLIFATPDQPVAVGSKPKDKDTFIIQLPDEQTKDVKVNWWIVN